MRQIVDREPAALLGNSMARGDTAALAVKLRQPGFALAARAREDAVAGRVVEVSGWVKAGRFCDALCVCFAGTVPQKRRLC